jgi:hypothetical protein
VWQTDGLTEKINFVHLRASELKRIENATHPPSVAVGRALAAANLICCCSCANGREVILRISQRELSYVYYIPNRSGDSSRRQSYKMQLSPLLIAFAWGWFVPTASAYPVILQVEEETERCFQINIPEDDDLHIVLLPLPDADEIEDDSVEAWYVEQVYKMTKSKVEEKGLGHNRLPDEPPKHVSEVTSEFLENKWGAHAPIKVRMNIISFEGQKGMTNYRSKFFTPLVINRVTKAGRNLPDVESVEICVTNTEEGEGYHIIFDSILDSEEIDEPEEGKKPTFQKDQHLTPLEESLEKSIQAARSVMREMDYMEKREKRMRVTSESINSRVQWFSYLSVAILVVVTYVQVTYLKRYFHKKKLM